MTHIFQDRVHSGIRNLLINCANTRPGQTLLIVHEASEHRFYEPELLDEIASAARIFGLVPELHQVPFDPNVNDPDPVLAAKIGRVDRTLFLARLGDQIRFHENGSSDSQIVSYILDRDMLASDFGNADFRAFDALKHMINGVLQGAKDIRVTCPAGTDFKGSGVQYPNRGADVGVKRFPMSVFTPAPAAGFAGRIAQVGFLVGTGSHYYHPYACSLSETLFIEFEGNRITGFDGNAEDVTAAKAHYRFVGEKYGIDPYFVHSWHAGIHPGCGFIPAASENFERWTGGAFGNPRLLHFHTCGAYPPGEISLNVLDPTVRIDGAAVWEDGRLYPDRIPGGAALMTVFPCARRAFDQPVRNVGQGPNGQLSFHSQAVG